MANILNTIYDDLKGLPKDLLKVIAVLLSGSFSAAILLKAVRPLAKLMGVLFVSFSMSFAAYKGVIEIKMVKGTFWTTIILWTTALISYPLANGAITLVVAVIEILSDRVKDFVKTYTPKWLVWLSKNKNNDTV